MSANKFIEANKKGYTYIDNSYLYDNRLSPTEKTVYAIICSAAYGDKDFTTVSQSTIAQTIKRSTRTVMRCIKKLKELSYISVRRRGSISNIMTIIAKKTNKVGQGVSNAVKKAYNAFKSHKTQSKTTWNTESRNYNFDALERIALGYEEYNPETILKE